MDYERLVRRALRGVVPLALEEIIAHGLTPPHHVYLTFRTDVPGIVLPARLRAKYPESMTIVLRDQYWDLETTAAGFAVTLSFGGAHERLQVPFAAVTALVDPSVPFGLQFDAPAGGAADADAAGEDAGAPAGADGAADDDATPEAPDDPEGNVVRLTDFRRTDET